MTSREQHQPDGSCRGMREWHNGMSSHPCPKSFCFLCSKSFGCRLCRSKRLPAKTHHLPWMAKQSQGTQYMLSNFRPVAHHRIDKFPVCRCIFTELLRCVRQGACEDGGCAIIERVRGGRGWIDEF